jgi:hypothetical protein
VRAALPRDASVSCDGETIMGLARQIVPSFGERRLFNAGTTGCMGTGVPYAIGAKLARPEAASVAILGDYAFGAAALEVETAGARRRAGRVRGRRTTRASRATRSRTACSRPARRGSPRSCPRTTRSSPSSSTATPSASSARPDPPALDRALASGKVAVVHVRVDPKATRLSGGVYLR